jgi:ribose transport system permease protein
MEGKKLLNKNNLVALKNYGTEVFVTLGLLVLFIFFSIISPYFFRVNNLSNVLYQVSTIGILAAGQCMVILTGGIDLSIGGIFTLSGWLMCFVIKDVGLLQGLLVGVGMGIFAGAVNGILIAFARLEPFIVTLGTMSIYNGVVYIISNSKAVSNLPVIMARIDEFRLFGAIPSYVLIVFIVYIFGQLFLSFTKPGRMLYAIGSNELAAKFSGIRVRVFKMLPYVITGFLCSVAAFVQSAHLLAIDANAGTNLNLDSITAVVIGGTSLLGGRGTLVGTAVGILMIGVLGNGLNLLGVSSYWQRVVVGIILIVAVTSQRMSLTKEGN